LLDLQGSQLTPSVHPREYIFSHLNFSAEQTSCYPTSTLHHNGQMSVYNCRKIIYLYFPTFPLNARYIYCGIDQVFVILPDNFSHTSEHHEIFISSRLMLLVLASSHIIIPSNFLRNPRDRWEEFCTERFNNKSQVYIVFCGW
jgi:hypothetical protein